VLPVGDPNTADWIMAWSTVAAAVGTVGALWVGALAFLRQAYSQRRDQASRVSVARDGNSTQLIVHNQSDRAIHYVTCWFKDGADPKIARYDDQPCDTSEDVLPAGGDFQTGSSRVPDELKHSAISYVEFTDATGNRWRRGRGGELSLIRKAKRRPESGGTRRGVLGGRA
jgi:hypothetical protein